MASKSRNVNLDQPRSHFMCSTEASRAQKVLNDTDLHYRDKFDIESATTPHRNQFIRRATQRITSLSTSKRRESKAGKSRLNISSPILQHSTKSSPVRLPSPSAKLSSLPDPVKREPLDSPTATDKPLPSLPVATVTSRSPIQRRSLIDATERPLHKSVSPNVIQDWPTLSPEITISKMFPSKTTSMERKNMISSAQKPSLGESVIERMRKLNLNTMKSEEGNDHFENESQDDTHKIISTPRNENTGDNIIARNSSFLDPRDAPLTPGTTNNTPVKNTETEGLTASHVSELPKACQSPCHDDDTPEPMSKELRNDHSKATPISSGSFIPRLSKVVPGTDNGDVSLVDSTPNSLHLRRTRLRIGETSFVSPSLKIGQAPVLSYGQGLDTYTYTDRASAVYRQSSLPLPERLIRHSRTETDHSRLGISTVESKVHQAADCSHGQQSSTSSEGTTTKHDPKPAPEAFTQSHPITNDKTGDSQSVVSRSHSVSSATSGTIYAYDEFGSYRLKPVSVSDRKNGPRVRIDDAADSLLLNEESLAKCHAKREAYENRYKIGAGDVKTIQPSDVQLKDRGRSIEQANTLEAGKTEESQNSLSTSTLNMGNVEVKTEDKASLPNKMAPPIPVDIPALSHSSTGWPLLVSRVAPFADIAPGEWISKAREKRKSASESDLRSTSPSPTATPAKHCKVSVEQSPASAYTLRTALNNSLFGSTMQRPHRSVRTTSTTHEYDSPLTQRTTGLRKTSSGLNKSYASQRAAFKSSPPIPDDIQINYAARVQSILSSTPTHHARNRKSNICDASAHEAKNTDSPSSTPAAPGSVSTGKGVMSNIKGLFHKQSSDKMTKSASNGSLQINRGASVQTPLVAFKPSPLRKTFNPNTPDTNTSARGAAPNGGTKRKFSLLHRDRGPDHMPSPQDGARENVESTSSQPFVTSALEPFEIRDATALAFILLDKARDSMDPDSQQDYIELAKLLVATISLSRESEKAMEEAQQAAARAEMEALKTRHSISEIVQKIQGLLDKQTDA